MVNDDMVFSESILASDTTSSFVTFVLTVLAITDLPPQDPSSSSSYYSVVVNPSYCKGEGTAVVGFNNTCYVYK